MLFVGQYATSTSPFFILSVTKKYHTLRCFVCLLIDVELFSVAIFGITCGIFKSLSCGCIGVLLHSCELHCFVALLWSRLHYFVSCVSASYVSASFISSSSTPVISIFSCSGLLSSFIILPSLSVKWFLYISFMLWLVDVLLLLLLQALVGWSSCFLLSACQSLGSWNNSCLVHCLWHSVIAPHILGIIELLCCLWTCTYSLNCSLQCLLKSILGPVIIVCGLSVGCMPSLCGKQFSQIWRCILSQQSVGVVISKKVVCLQLLWSSPLLSWCIFLSLGHDCLFRWCLCLCLCPVVPCVF